MKNRTFALLGGLSLVLTLGLSACGSDDGDTDGGAAPAPEEEGAAGFVEYPIEPEQVVGPLNVAAVYFQPVDMEPAGMGLAAADADFHIEADISATEGNDLGYGAGDFVPNLTVDYSIVAEDGTVKGEGTFMPMNASDGPHYGANIALKDAGTYKVTFIIHSPEENGHLLHVDKETGVDGRFWTEPLEVSWDWDYTPQEW